MAYPVFPSEGESAPSSSGSPAKSSIVSDGSARSSGSSTSGTRPSKAPEPVQTQQPCSLKGSFSSDNIYGGGMATHVGPGQGTCTHMHAYRTSYTHTVAYHTHYTSTVRSTTHIWCLVRFKHTHRIHAVYQMQIHPNTCHSLRCGHVFKHPFVLGNNQQLSLICCRILNSLIF